MVTKAQKIRLGVFILLTFILMLVFIVLIVGRQVFERRDTYRIVYENISVSGLQVGAQVKYHGIRIGRVDALRIDPENVNNVIVDISVEQGTPIKSDAQAQLIIVGITGLKQIEILGGTNEAPTLEPGSTIMAGISLFDDISGRAEIILNKLDVVLSNIAGLTNPYNQEKLTNILTNLDYLMEENKGAITGIVSNIDSISVNIAQISNSAAESFDKINTVINSPEVERILTNTAKFSDDLSRTEIDVLASELQSTLEQINRTFTHIDLTFLRGRRDILITLETMKEAVDYLNEFSRAISEDPSLLLRRK